MFDNILGKCKEVENGRNVKTIFNHMESEMDELWDEVNRFSKGISAGEDGISGEAVDVILCALDLISKSNPEMTDDDLKNIIDKKFNKWKMKYGSK